MISSFSKIILLLWCLLAPFFVFAQQKCIKGQLIDLETNKPVAGANIYISQTNKTVHSDSTGFFELCDLKQPKAVLHVSHLSFESQTIETITGKAIQIFLIPKNYQFDEVTVSSRKRNELKEMPGQQKINQAQVFQMPTLMGEADVLRTLQQLPGVQSVSEGVNGIFVRGGSAGQNLVTLDNMELMNPVHLMGIYSVFNPLTTSTAEIFKGNTPVNQRSKIASSIDARSFDPTQIDNALMGSIGNIASNLAVSLKTPNNKWGFIAGIRRSYLETMRAASNLAFPNETNYFETYFYSFYDFNGTISYTPSPKTSFAFGWYMGADNFEINNSSVGYDADNNYGNKSLKFDFKTLLWNTATLTATVNGTKAWSGFNGELLGNKVGFESQFNQLSAKLRLSIPTTKHLFSFGIDTYKYRTTPQNLDFTIISDTIQQRNDFYNDDVSVFVEDSYQLTGNLLLYAGIRVYKFWNYAEIDANDGWSRPSKPLSSYTPIAPLVAISYRIDEKSTYKMSYSHNVQTSHLASLSSVPLPNDIWVMSSASLKPETAHQISLTYNRSLNFGAFSTEVYGKYLDNQLIFNVNTDKNREMAFEDHFFKGIGKTYGIEFSLSKTKGNFTGMLNYTLSRSLRSFLNIYEGEWFNDKFDRIHDASLLACYKLNNKWDFSANWVFATGNCTTLPAGRYWAMGNIMNDYDGYNTFRLPPYHRLDISANWHLESRLFKQSVLNFSIINLYNRSNPYFVFYKVYQGDNQYDIEIKASQISLFPIMPSINWRFTL